MMARDEFEAADEVLRELEGDGKLEQALADAVKHLDQKLKNGLSSFAVRRHCSILKLEITSFLEEIQHRRGTPDAKKE